MVPNENIIKDIFSTFGKIKEISEKNTGFGPSIYVEFYKYEDAQKAVEEMKKESSYENKRKIGDPNCDITFYFQRKQYPENIPHNNINNIRPLMFVLLYQKVNFQSKVLLLLMLLHLIY